MHSLKILFIASIAFLTVFEARSQSLHNTNCMHCKFSKNYIGNWSKEGKGRASDECGCNACYEKQEKEIAAIRAAEKQRADALRLEEKLKNEAIENANRERLQAIENEKKLRAIEEGRLKKEAEASKARLANLLKKYEKAPSNTAKSSKNQNYIEELEGFDDDKKRVFGIKLNNEIVISKVMPSNATIYVKRLSNTNYFLLQYIFSQQSDYYYKDKNNVYQLMNKYGEIMSINGETWFLNIREENAEIFFLKVDQPLTKSHPEGIFSGSPPNRYPELIFKTKEELLAVHQSRIDAINAEYAAKRANMSHSSGAVLIGYNSSLYSASGVSFKTNLDLKVLSSEHGIVHLYL